MNAVVEASSWIEPLAWDTEHFGVSTARIRPRLLTNAQLDAVLHEARDTGIRLAYWPAEPEQDVDPAILLRHGGLLADRKAVFRGKLTDLLRNTTMPGPDSMAIGEVDARSAPPGLLDLAIDAGAFSRFAVDPHIPRSKFSALYRRWMERSLRHELADVVLVAGLAAEPDWPRGMVTVKVTDEEGVIGLIAVHARARRQGLAARLLAAAHQYMNRRGATTASVVTQFDNVPACRLYEAAGYRLAELTHFYHFWLS